MHILTQKSIFPGSDDLDLSKYLQNTFCFYSQNTTEPVNLRGARMVTIQKWSTATVLPPGQANHPTDHLNTCEASVEFLSHLEKNTLSELLLDHHGIVTHNRVKLLKFLNFSFFFFDLQNVKWLIISEMSCLPNPTWVPTPFRSRVHPFKSASKWQNFTSLTDL